MPVTTIPRRKNSFHCSPMQLKLTVQQNLIFTTWHMRRLRLEICYILDSAARSNFPNSTPSTSPARQRHWFDSLPGSTVLRFSRMPSNQRNSQDLEFDSSTNQLPQSDKRNIAFKWMNNLKLWLTAGQFSLISFTIACITLLLDNISSPPSCFDWMS